MAKKFNVAGDCKPELHYMVDIGDRLIQIKKMIDDGQYFFINRARQYGKTTMLRTLRNFLAEEYIVIFLDFQNRMSELKFRDEHTFSVALAYAFLRELKLIGQYERFSGVIGELKSDMERMQDIFGLVEAFEHFSNICAISDKSFVLIIDEVDTASNNQVFLDFLAQLRGIYIDRDRLPTFQSVILAGVHDIRNLRGKIRPDEEHKHNSPWNISESFTVDMSFSAKEIEGMLSDYERDYHTGMDKESVSKLIYDYTSGYPVLVSGICKLMDERIVGTSDFPTLSAAWTKDGILEAKRILGAEKTPLLESLINKLEDDERLEKLLYSALFFGRTIPYNPYDATIDVAAMYGFIKNRDNTVAVANRIFETTIYDWFLSGEMPESSISNVGEEDKNRFIKNGHLNMELILNRFVEHFTELYGDKNEKFAEDDGRRYFLLYLRPIINGTGNYYVEARTRNRRRTDVIVDYKGEQFVIEMKIWHGNEYNERGEKQLSDYLDYYHIKKGYMLSFNFNQNKHPGVRTIRFQDKMIIEAVV